MERLRCSSLLLLLHPQGEQATGACGPVPCNGGDDWRSDRSAVRVLLLDPGQVQRARWDDLRCVANKG